MDVAYNVQPPRPNEISHEVAIDTISTLGQTVVAALLANKSPISAWSEQSKQRVMELATYRNASVKQVHAQFPDLFTAATEATAHHGDSAWTPDLQDAFVQLNGTLPVLITAPHNGWRRALGERDLPRAPHSKASDGATRFIAQDIHRFLQARDLPAPTILMDAVHRAHRTPQTRAFFEYKTYEALCNLRREHDGTVLHLDIHGFGNHPETQDYDLILGTAHRETVGDSDVDHELASFTRAHGYRTYLPGTQPRPGEAYTAKSPATLVQRVAHLALAQTASVQIEISQRYRTQETQHRGQQLARDVGAFCVTWGQSPLESELGISSFYEAI
ncbi:MAG TPA: hypothetical protein VJ843_04325 [Candidatus Saccharimonadales bacterium]|nr:hypothetical protein [Candidatus Saccharimonadales bacterium]